MVNIAIYTRLSQDDGNQTATHRQRSACEAFASMRSWDITRVYEDVDLSAFKPGIVRPDYEAMLHAIAAGQFDGVVTWKLDRLVRRPAEFERFWTTCEQHNTFLTSAMEPIDSSTDLGLAIVRILVAFASLESATIGVRLRAKFRERAERGLPNNTAPAYGYRRGWTELEPDQAQNIRDAARRVVAGEALNSIATDWNSRGIKPLRAARWSTQQLRDLLLSHRLVGDRAYHGEVVATDCWPPVLDRKTADRVRAILTDPSRRTSFPSPERPLLAGFMWCGRCGSRLHATTQWKSNSDVYGCPAPPTGCSGITVVRGPATDAVVKALHSRLAEHGVGTTPGPAPIVASAVGHVVDDYARSLTRLAVDFYVDRSITRAQFHEARDALTADFDSNAELDPDWRPPALRHVRGPKPLATAWYHLSRDEQRLVISSEVARVIVHPRPGYGQRFDPSRLEIVWRRDLLRTERSTAWLSVRESAERLEVTRKAVYRYIRDGTLYGEKAGNTWLVRRTDVDRVQTSGQVTMPSPS